MKDDCALLDSGDGKKLEQFGPHRLARPCAQAVWASRLGPEVWRRADASFDREDGNRWQNRDALPASWVITVAGIRFKLSGTDFGHLGVFPEQRELWIWVRKALETWKKQRGRAPIVLNLFAYSGGITLAAAQAGAEVCHVDASRGMVAWARENAALNGLPNAPVRWIVDDVRAFLAREEKRAKHYDAIILDPPTYGRGKQGEVFTVEKHLCKTLEACGRLLSQDPAFVLLSCHTPGITPRALENLLRGIPPPTTSGWLESGEMLLTGEKGVWSVPSGAWARWRNAAPNHMEPKHG